MKQENSRQDLVDFLDARDFDRSRQHRPHRLRPDAYADPEYVYFFTVCARRQREPFRRPEVAEAVVDALLWRRANHRWRLFCYCLMPDHLHFVAQLPDHPVRSVNGGVRGVGPEGILEHLRDFKKFTTTNAWWLHGGSGQLWQRSSYDRVLGFGASPDEVIAYVLNNPVRKGLVERWEDYPYVRIVDEWQSG